MIKLVSSLSAAAIVVAPLFLAPATEAKDERVDQLLWQCAPTEAHSAQAHIGFARCLGYIDGILDAHQMMVAIAKANPFFCLPPQGISLDQASRIFVKWASDNPKDMHQTARVGVLLSLRLAFPCRPN